MANPIHKYRVLDGGLVDVPIYLDHRRARNWAATVKPDQSKPGGMSRKWWNQGRGGLVYYVLPEILELHEVVEFGADMMAWSGNRAPNRVYGVVVELTDRMLGLALREDPMAAFLLADDLREQAKRDRDRSRGGGGPGLGAPPASDTERGPGHGE